MKRLRIFFTVVPQIAGALIATESMAQSTPDEFAELSLHQLFEQRIDESFNDGARRSPWTLAHQYKYAKFEGYLDGSDSLSFNDVLWNGPAEPRTTKNFPILPTVITQMAAIIGVGYQFNKNWQGRIFTSYIEQKSEHISIVKNYDFFTIESHGVGDTTVSASYTWDDSARHLWQLSMGLSLPTGSIDEVGDTPRAPGDQQLPYTMQLGSGTFDIPVELTYRRGEADGLDFSVAATVRTGKNDRYYRLGNNISVSSRYQIQLSPTLRTFAAVSLNYSEAINGQDTSLLVNAPIPYPASITNPELYGGKKASLGLGLTWKLSEAYRLSLEVSKPLYQYLNGPQSKEQWRNALSISRTQ